MIDENSIRIISLYEDREDLPGGIVVHAVVEFDVPLYLNAHMIDTRALMRECRKWMAIMETKGGHLPKWQVLFEMHGTLGNFPSVDGRNLTALAGKKYGRDTWIAYLKGEPAPIKRGDPIL